MESQSLKKAREYEKLKEKNIKKEERPEIHFSPRVGWMNDPNGFSYYNGKYHLFYQNHPYDAYWGPMHWGHAVSEDLLHWEYLPAALAPDHPYDQFGCFSGSAITLQDGRQLLMYTGVERIYQPDGSYFDKQQQCLAVGDGVNYEKWEHNPILTEKNIPQNCSATEFRDPKMWKNEDGTYSCVVVNLAANKSGQILFYTSKDGFEWEFKSVLLENNNRFGIMWECPDVFHADGRDVVLISPMEMQAEGLEYPNGNGTVAFIGQIDRKNGTFTYEKHQAVDYGIDFYAMQTLQTPDGRCIMIGWMQNWATGNLHSREKKWFGQMSLPREVSVINGRLVQKPIRELKQLRSNKAEYQEVIFTDSLKLEGINGRIIDMEIEVVPENSGEIYRKFEVCFAQDETYHTSVTYHPHEAVLELDRRFSGSRCAAVHQRCCHVPSKNGTIKLRIILDRFSAEIFVNDGEKVMTTTMYTEQDADGISFFADGKVKMNIVKYDLVR